MLFYIFILRLYISYQNPIIITLILLSAVGILWFFAQWSFALWVKGLIQLQKK